VRDGAQGCEQLVFFIDEWVHHDTCIMMVVHD
jgi:hypothetical protein